MGTEALWIPAVMAVVGAGATYANNRQMAKKQDKITAQSLLKNDERQRRADQQSKELVERTGASTAEPEKRSVLQGLMGALQANQKNSVGGLLDAGGGGSNAYATEAANAALGIAASGQEDANIASRLEAPVLQRQREGLDRGATARQHALIGREQEGADVVTGLRLRSVRSNPWLLALAAAAGGASQGNYGGGAGAGSAVQKEAITMPKYDWQF